MFRVCITGANGFLGNRFLELNKNKYKIYKISFNPKRKSSYNLKSKKDFNNLKKFLKKKKIDYFINFGWSHIANPNSKIHIKKNIIYFKKLIKILNTLQIKKFISIGSIDEYRKVGNLDENSGLLNYKSKNFYAYSKILVYKYLKKNYKRSFLHLRIPNVYGFKKNKKFLINKVFLLSKKYNLRKKVNLTNLNQERIYIYLDDLIKIIDKVSFDTSIKDIINIGKGKSISIREYIDIYLKILKKNKYKHKFNFNMEKKLKKFSFQSKKYKFANFRRNLKFNLEQTLKKQEDYFNS